MDNTLSQAVTKTDAEYEAEFYETMAEIKQYEATFDKLHAEIVAMQEAAERRSARRRALNADIERLIQNIWGTRWPDVETNS